MGYTGKIQVGPKPQFKYTTKQIHCLCLRKDHKVALNIRSESK